jgi:isocitrate dehydrogenase (NAD+)
MMLDHLKESSAAAKIRNAVNAVYREGKNMTKDLSAEKYVGTAEFTDAILEKMN